MPKRSPSSTEGNDRDAPLVRAVQSGRKGRFLELVERYQDRLYRFGRQICRRSDEAEDLVQETFLNAFRYIDGFRMETSFKNWLYRIAASICIKRRRKTAPAKGGDLPVEAAEAAGETPWPNGPPPWARLPLDQVLNAELGEVVAEGIRALAEDHRLVLVLRDVEGVSTAETARILEITPANVKVRLHRARTALRDRLKAYFEDDQIP